MIKQIIVVRKDLIDIMGCGKLAAQVAHASSLAIINKMRGFNQSNVIKNNESYRLFLDINKDSDIKKWIEGDYTKIVLYVKTKTDLLKLNEKLIENGIVTALIEDNGNTVFNKKTVTCLGIEPLSSDIIDKYTKRLRLL